MRPWNLNLVHHEIPKLTYIFFSSNEMEINNKNNTNNKTHFEFIPFGPRLLMFASYLLQFCLQALESLSVSCIQETISLKAISINLWRENNREIYRGKKKRWGGCNLSMTIRIPFNSSIWRVWVNGETHNRVGDRVTSEFKKRLNKCQSINQKIKKKERK